jgi:2-methylcitrate dehydratase PrpD
VAQALSLAASSAAGLVANFGTMAKPWHAGRAAAAAIDAVRLAQLGMTAATDVFEHHAGFLPRCRQAVNAICSARSAVCPGC